MTVSYPRYKFGVNQKKYEGECYEE